MSWQVLIVLAEFAVVCAVVGGGMLVQRVRRRAREQHAVVVPATRDHALR